MKTTMVARRRVCSPREGGSAAPSRGSAAAYRAGGRMLRPQLFLPTLVRAAGPGCRMPGGRMLARRSSCARRGRSRGGGGESGGRRGRPGCSQRAPGAGRRRARPLLWPPARPQPSLPSCTKRAGTRRAWHGTECRECPPNCCAQGESCRIIHINHTWSPLGPATLQTGVPNWEELGGFMSPGINPWDMLQHGRSPPHPHHVPQHSSITVTGACGTGG